MLNELINFIGTNPNDNPLGFVCGFCFTCFMLFNVFRLLYLLLGVDK